MRLSTPLLLAVLALFALGCKGKGAAAEAEREELLDRPVDTVDLVEGKGEPMDTGYRCSITYVGKLAGGEVPFETNDTKDADGRGTKAPYMVVIGSRHSILGLEIGMVGMKKGGTRKITIPWQKGYGKEGHPDGNIPPKSDLEFTVTLHDYVKPGEESKFDYEEIKVGSGRAVKEGDTVTIHYRASYPNGMIFDDSRKRGEKGTPYTFRVGAYDAIQGVDYGIRGMKVGGIRKLWIPPLLVFGENGYSVIQGGQIIYVDVELLHVS
jgi:FKBP-type peptidyl-prolyl cis-trans isomerase